MFSFIGAGEDVIKVATTISITNTMVWENTVEGTKKMFDEENDARMSFCMKYDDLVDPCMSVSEKKLTRKKLSAEYYKK
jgi:hypothetical protein